MHKDIDRILANEEEISPSSTFLDSVMQEVEREAAAPPPLLFPWLRAAPGFGAAIVALGVAIGYGAGSTEGPVAGGALDALLLQAQAAAADMGLHWILLASAITAVSVVLGNGLAGIGKSRRISGPATR